MPYPDLSAPQRAFAEGQRSYIAGCLPETAVQMSTDETLALLRQRLGDALDRCLDPQHTQPSPVGKQRNGAWLRHSNMVGINVRTVQHFWNVVKYTLTLPALHDAIHLLPIWEPGVAGSLYGICSWQINPEFFSNEWRRACPQLDTVEKQLKATVNLLHALGRSVGLDVIPHTDRFSEIVLTHPGHFEWLRRVGPQIVDHREDLHQAAEQVIFEFLQEKGCAVPQVVLPRSAGLFFSKIFEADLRHLALFGEPKAYGLRLQRRLQVIDRLYAAGLEPVPATMAPPYRGLRVDTELPPIADEAGHLWYEYLITRPEAMSRVFGPLTRYKLYGRIGDNESWEIDFDRPRPEVWQYVAAQYARIVEQYHFDFMRGDMSHVQMRPDGVPVRPDAYYDVLGYIKAHIAKRRPYFGYFAETFMAPPNYMQYGNEIDHLEAAGADSTLGDLQSVSVSSPQFLQRLRQYDDVRRTRHVAPNFTLMTADKDDPRFDDFYVGGNVPRYFIGLFLSDMPSYMGLGFECRDSHLTPAPNEHYTKLYVFHFAEGPKATRGPYQWGRNRALFEQIDALRALAEQHWALIGGQATRWLLPPDPTAGLRVVAWTQAGQPALVFVANLDARQFQRNVRLPRPDAAQALQGKMLHSTQPQANGDWLDNGLHVYIGDLAPDECRIYRLGPP